MNRLAFLALAAAGVFWGMGFPLGKLALRETDAAQVVLLRFAVAALVALPFALRGRETRALFRSPVVLLAGALYGVAFLVQFEGPATFSGFMALKIFIEDLLGARVDLITESGLREGVRSHVEREAIRVA